MSRKLFARGVRFEAALKRKKQAPGLRWTDVAHELGYYDHMHMVHDFELLAGATPSDHHNAHAASALPEIVAILSPAGRRR